MRMRRPNTLGRPVVGTRHLRQFCDVRALGWRQSSTRLPSDGREPTEAHVMPTERAERVIVNPASGERIVIRTSGAETGGRLLAFDLYLPPGAHVPARHVHPHQVESFTVLEGRMRFTIGRRLLFA